MDNLIINSKTNLEPLLEISDEAERLGLVVKYETIEYRGETVFFLSDPSGDHCFAQWNNRLIDLGLNNIYYIEDMCKFIDRQLDFITDFRDSPNFIGAKLEYFHNGDFRDIRLLYKGRTLKIFLVASETAVNLSYIIRESKNILLKSGLLDEIQTITDYNS